jgi:hypothetical protein
MIILLGFERHIANILVAQVRSNKTLRTNDSLLPTTKISSL